MVESSAQPGCQSTGACHHHRPVLLSFFRSPLACFRAPEFRRSVKQVKQVKQSEHVSHQVELQSSASCMQCGGAMLATAMVMAGETHFKLLKADSSIAISVAHVHRDIIAEQACAVKVPVRTSNCRSSRDTSPSPNIRIKIVNSPWYIYIFMMFYFHDVT